MKVPLLLLLFSTASYSAGPQTIKLSQLVVDTWNRESGLPQNTITSIAQTPDGYLWLATRIGLVRFDGVRSTLFDRSNLPGLGTNIITKLKVDPQGNLWVAPLEPGILRFDGTQWTHFGPAQGLPTREVAELHLSPKGKLWFAPSRGGLLEWDGNRFQPLPTPQPLPPSSLLRSLQTSDGNLWLGTAEHGLIRWKGSEWETFNVSSGLWSNGVWGLAESPQGTLWVGGNKGVTAIVNGRVNPGLAPAELRDKAIEFASQTAPDEIWWGTYRDGLYRSIAGTVESLAAGSSPLVDNHIRCALRDAEGSFWVGTQQGLNRFSQPRILFYGESEGFNTLSASKIALTPQSEPVQAFRSGEIRAGFSANSRSISIHPGRDTEQDILGVSPDGTIWIRDSKPFLYALKAGRYLRQDIPPGQTPVAFLELSSGLRLIGTRQGNLYQLSGTTWTAFPQPFPIKDASITFITEAPDSTLWVGTRNGLAALRQGQWKVWNKSNGLPSNLISAFTLDSNGRPWIGTASGLLLYDHGKFFLLNKQRGLPDDGITALAFDDSGTLWGASNDGVFRLRSAAIATIPGNPQKIAVDGFNAKDGLRYPEGRPFTGASKGADGSIWFLMIRGLVQIIPARFTTNPAPPRSLIEDLLVDGAPVPIRPDTFLPSQASRLEFHFTSLSLLRPERNRFRYRLIGYDKDWIDAAGQRSAIYTGLPGGDYRFEVLGTNGDGVPSRSPASFSFHKTKVFSETVWFWLLVALVLAGLGYAFLRLRIRQLNAKHQLVLAERQRIARELHDGLLQEFNGATFQLAAIQLENSGTPVAVALERVVGGLELSLKESRQAIQTLRGRDWDGVPLYTALQECADGLCRSKGVKVQCQQIGNVPEPSTEIKETFWQIARESIRNSLRHARPSQLKLELLSSANEIVLRIEDDGCGFVPASISTPENSRFGLKGLRERAQSIGGQFHLDSKPGAGCRVEVRLPRRNAR